MTRTVAVIAPAAPAAHLPPALREHGVRALGRLGWQPTFAASIDRRDLHSVAHVDRRLEDLYWAYEHPQAELVMPALGGYDTNQLLDRVDFGRLAQSGVPLCGYSDVTAFLLAAYGRGLPVLHGPGFASFCDPDLSPYTASSFARVLAGEAVTYSAPAATAEGRWNAVATHGPRELRPLSGWGVHRAGEAEGPLAGGNLETLCALAGTPYLPDLYGHILFVDNGAGDGPGAFHRRLTQLRQLGMFDRIAALVVGVMPHASSLRDRELLGAILDDVVRGKTAFPIVTDVSCSHVDPMMTLPLGRRCTVTTWPAPRLAVAAAPRARTSLEVAS